MNCYYHPSTTIVATCQDCKKGLCKSCSDKFNIPICTTCNRKRVSAEMSEILTNFAWMIGIAIAGLWLCHSFIIKELHVQQGGQLTKVFFYIFLFYSFVAIVVGWKTLNRLTSNYFLFLPLIGWVIFLGVKLYAATMVGMFVAPFWIVKNIYRLIVLNNRKI